jgi:hypothetical protein
VKRTIAAPRPDTEVVGLYVAVRHPFTLENTDDLQQVVTEPVQKIEPKSTLGDEAIGKRQAVAVFRIASRRQPERGPAANALDAQQLDNPNVPEVGEGTSFIA